MARTIGKKYNQWISQINLLFKFIYRIYHIIIKNKNMKGLKVPFINDIYFTICHNAF